MEGGEYYVIHVRSRLPEQEVCKWVGARTRICDAAARIAGGSERSRQWRRANPVGSELEVVLSGDPGKGVTKGRELLIFGRSVLRFAVV